MTFSRPRPSRPHLEPWLGVELEGRYVVREHLATGGMGAVFKGWDPRLEQAVAVKVLPAWDDTDAQDLERRFSAEAKLLARIRDPRVVRPLSWGRAENGALYIVTEFLEGRPLDAVIREDGPLEAVRTVRILLDVAGALGEAHAVGIIHRDLKPANVFVQASQAGGEIARLLDFGIAKLLRGRPDAEAPATESGVVLGTPLFMSPEQVQGRPLDGRSDLYALGLVAFACLSGERPFDGEGPQVMLAHAIHPAPRVSDRAPGPVDPILDQLVADLLEKAPDRRPRTAAEVRDRLEAWLAGGHAGRAPLRDDTEPDPVPSFPDSNRSAEGEAPTGSASPPSPEARRSALPPEGGAPPVEEPAATDAGALIRSASTAPDAQVPPPADGSSEDLRPSIRDLQRWHAPSPRLAAGLILLVIAIGGIVGRLRPDPEPVPTIELPTAGGVPGSVAGLLEGPPSSEQRSGVERGSPTPHPPNDPQARPVASGGDAARAPAGGRMGRRSEPEAEAPVAPRPGAEAAPPRARVTSRIALGPPMNEPIEDLTHALERCAGTPSAPIKLTVSVLSSGQVSRVSRGAPDPAALDACLDRTFDFGRLRASSLGVLRLVVP